MALMERSTILPSLNIFRWRTSARPTTTRGIGTNGEEVDELGEILIDGYPRCRRARGLGIFGAGEGGGHRHVSACHVHAGRAGAARACRCRARRVHGVCYHDGRGGRSKQFPDVYELALRRLEERHGHKFNRSWVFEDAVFGLKSSGTAGFKRVGIYDPHGRMERTRFAITAISLSTAMRTWTWPACFRLRARRGPWLAKYWWFVVVGGGEP